MILDKKEIRASFLKTRSNLSEARRKEANENAFKVLIKLVQNFNNVLSFTSKKDEVDISDINSFLAKENLLHLPRAHSSKLEIYKVTDLSGLINNPHYYLLEPNPQTCQSTLIDIIDLVLVPGVAFDNQKNRLGFGKAYYDKLLINMPKATKIGIGFKEQLSDKILPVEKHDVPLNDIYLF